MFTHARLKLKRANEHIAEVYKRIKLIVHPDSQTSWIELDPKSGVQQIHYELERLGDLTDVALVVGDAIHNLNTVLDYSWVQVITKIVPSAINGHSKFPVYESINKLESVLKGKALRIDMLSPRLFDLMISKIKPCQGGNDFIWAVHELDILDKHRLLIEPANYGSISGLKIQDQRTGGVRRVVSWGGELQPQFSVAIGAGLKIQDKGYLSLNIVFKQGPLQALEVSDGLRIFSGTVLKVLELLENIVES